MKKLYEVDHLPVFQNKMYETPEAAIACPKGDVVLVQNTKSGLIFNSAFDPSLLQYDSSYQNEQACSPFFLKHLHEVGRIIQRHCGGMHLVEIGCGKGFFLEYITSLGFQITGFDPAYEGNNPSIKKTYYGPGFSVGADGIILRHVLEHVANPVDFLLQIQAVAGDAMIYIEVPCFDWICRKRAWFDIFYEHVNYFRGDDFQRLFGRIHEAGHLFGGQYLYVLADIASLREPLFEGEAICFPNDFLKGLFSASQKVKESTEDANAIWGGSSKGVIFSLLMERMGAKIKNILDINPSKQGKYLGGTGLRVSPPEDILKSLPDGANIFIMNSNYAEEIVEMAGDRFQYWRIDDDF